MAQNESTDKIYQQLYVVNSTLVELRTQMEANNQHVREEVNELKKANIKLVDSQSALNATMSRVVAVEENQQKWLETQDQRLDDVEEEQKTALSNASSNQVRIENLESNYKTLSQRFWAAVVIAFTSFFTAIGTLVNLLFNKS